MTMEPILWNQEKKKNLKPKKKQASLKRK